LNVAVHEQRRFELCAFGIVQPVNDVYLHADVGGCVWAVCAQDHYDFGMRALKSVLVMAGSLKRANPDLPEDIVLIRAMRDSNLPKFLVADVELFCNIIGDLFPGVQVPDQVSLQPAESLLPLAQNSHDPGTCWFDAVDLMSSHRGFIGACHT
jgi:hypothetical protein